MQHYFNPYTNIYKNIQRYASAGLKSHVKILICIINKVYSNQRVDIYVPYTSTIMESIPFVFGSFSEEQGDITMPEENSLSLLVTASDGTKFVYGGLSLSKTYIIRNILPGESERYVKESSYKQDLSGNHIFLSKPCSTEIFGADGIHQSFFNGSYIDNGSSEEFSGKIICSDKTTKFIRIKKVYQDLKTAPVFYNELDDCINQKQTLEQLDDIEQTISSYLASIQNLKDNYSEERLRSLRTDIQQKYRQQRKLCMIIEEGNAVNKIPMDRIDFSNLNEENLIYDVNHSSIIYRVRMFDSLENVIFSLSIFASGHIEKWEKMEEIIIKHELNDYPSISLLQADFNGSNLRPIKFDVTYLSKDELKVSINRKYSVVKTVDNQGNGQYEIIMENGIKLLLILSFSAKKMEQIIKQNLSLKL